MRLLPHEVLRARRRRGPLIALTWTSLLLLVASVWSPRLQPWLGTARVVSLIAALTATLLASFAALRGARTPGWSVFDEAGWVLGLGTLATFAGLERAPVGMHAFLYVFALVTLAFRDPSGSLVVFACATTGLALVVRTLTTSSPWFVLPMTLVTLFGGFAFVSLVLQTRRFVRALAERDAFRTALQQEQQGTHTAAPRAETTANADATVGSENRTPTQFFDENANADDLDFETWEALVQKMRNAIALVSENAGIPATVEAETRGLAPPTDKIRSHLVRLAEEAASQTAKHANASSLNLRLRRADGGIVLEIEDDGDAGESARAKRTLAAMRPRVAALGGTAEVRRADHGWVTRVRVPHDQLN